MVVQSSGYVVITVNISLPEKMKDWIDSQVESGRYEDASDFLRDLVRKAQAEEFDLPYLQRAVDEGMASGFHEAEAQGILPAIKKRFAGQ
jgi:antitoxin ParD1/3/4